MLFIYYNLVYFLSRAGLISHITILRCLHITNSRYFDSLARNRDMEIKFFETIFDKLFHDQPDNFCAADYKSTAEIIPSSET